MDNVKQTCKHCGGAGWFVKTVATSFGGGEQEETRCDACCGFGVAYERATEAKPSASVAPGIDPLYSGPMPNDIETARRMIERLRMRVFALSSAIAAAREEARKEENARLKVLLGEFAGQALQAESVAADLRARLAAPQGEAVAALRQIADMVPATQEMSLAHEMAQIAEDALRAFQPQAKAPQQPPAGEDAANKKKGVM